MDDILKSGCFESPLGCTNVDWSGSQFMKKENKVAFYFKITKKDIIMTEKDVEHYRKINICQFCEKNIEFDKFRDHCHLQEANIEYQLVANVI